MSLRSRAEHYVRRWLTRRGLALSRRPAPFLARDGAALTVTLPMVVEYHLTVHRPADFFFAQVGAFDGVANDPIRPLVVRHRWRGVLAEPQPEAFRSLSRTYADQPQVQLERVAVAPEPGRRTLYSVRAAREGLPDWVTQLASFRLDTILWHRREIPDIEGLVEETEVECVTLDGLLERAGADRLDLLQVDAEGYDAEILRSVDLERIRPAIVRYEHKHLTPQDRDACAELLLTHGYRLAFDVHDTLAYREDED